jgi:hypothetical protein
MQFIVRCSEVIEWRIRRELLAEAGADKYGKDYISWDIVSCKDLDKIVEIVNMFFKSLDSPYRVYWSAGEILPATKM